MSFKVGDKVRIVKNTGSHGAFYWAPEMDKTVGSIGTVIEYWEPSGAYHVSLKSWPSWWYLPESLELVKTVEPSSTDTGNPKDALGSVSLPMTMLSPLACAHGALGKYNGMLKYGLANFIGTKVRMSVYMDAIRRHFDAILMGEEVDPIDGVNHWGAIMANIDIILCAEAAGTLIDDRARADGQLDAVRKLKPLVKSLQELHREKNPKHFYMREVEGESIPI
jgi:hypothetical protein